MDKHALLKTDYVVPCDVQPWMTEEIMFARREKCKGERVLRKSRLEVHLQMFNFEIASNGCLHLNETYN